MLSLQNYGSSSSSDEESTEEGPSTSAAANRKEDLPDHLKPLSTDPSFSIASRLAVVAAPDVMVNVSIFD